MDQTVIITPHYSVIHLELARQLAVVIGVGAGGGLLAGMLGMGGAVLMLPALTMFAGLTLRQAAGVTVVQVTMAGMVGWLSYRRHRLVHEPLAVQMGLASAAGGLASGYASGRVPDALLSYLFLAVVLAALALLVLPFPGRGSKADEDLVTRGGKPGAERQSLHLPATGSWPPSGDPILQPPYNQPLAVALGGAQGLLAGLLGAGGGFLIVPLLVSVLRLPLRLAIGTSLVIILIGSASGLVGRLLGGQIQYELAAALVLGAVPATWLGARLNPRVPARILRGLLISVLLLVAAPTLAELVPALP